MSPSGPAKKQNDENPQGEIDIIKYATDFPIAATYYKQQFDKIYRSRSKDADFLYTLKFCSDLRLPRTLENLSRIQKILLESEPPDEPAKRLSIWVYQLWEGLISSYSLHELAKRAIDYSEEKKPKVMRNLCDRFSEIMQEYIDSPASIRAAGSFMGQNIQFLPRGNKQELLPDNISHLCKSKDLFLLGLAEGAGSTFHLLNDCFQIEILELASK